MLAVVDVCFILRKTIQTYCISTAAAWQLNSFRVSHE
nr:MAG TPA: hypothetical protein [Caudoviricetes sp.]